MRNFGGCGRRIAARYLLIATVANLLWEVAQLPLYTIWQTATTGALAFAVAHCTAGDIIILIFLVRSDTAAYPQPKLMSG